MIKWRTTKTKYIANVTAADIPRGLSADDVGFDEEDWARVQEKLTRLEHLLEAIQKETAPVGYDNWHWKVHEMVTEALKREF